MSNHNRRVRSPKGSLSFRIRFAKLASFLPSNKRVLEIGCGNGLITQELIKRKNRVTAIDSELAVIKKLKPKFEMVKFINQDFSKFKSVKKFDYLICTEVLEHLKDDKKALEKMLNLLAKNGRLVLSVPISQYKKEYLETFGHYRHYTPCKLKRLIGGVGFQVEEELVWGSFIRYLIMNLMSARSREGINNRVGKLKNILWPLAKLDLAFCPLRTEYQLVLRKRD